MFGIVSVLIIVVCALLILIVLVQNSKGGGLASGISGSQVMGVRKTADFLEKATWTLATSAIALCIIANLVLPRNGEKQEKSLLQDEIQNTVDPNAVPNFPTAAPENAPATEEPAPAEKK